MIEVRATLDSQKAGVRRPPKTRESVGSAQLIPQAVAALKAQLIRNELAGSWVFPASEGGPLNISNLTRRVYYPAIRRAKLIERPLYNLRHTFAVFMLEAGENPGWVATVDEKTLLMESCRIGTLLRMAETLGLPSPEYKII